MHTPTVLTGEIVRPGGGFHAGSSDRDIQNATGHQSAVMIGYYDANTSPIIHNSVHRMGAFVEGAW